MEDMVMRNSIDFAPYRRSSIGFDRLFDLMENSARVDQTDGYPPFDIEQREEDSYRITLAVAGFSRGEIDITTKPNLLVISGSKSQEREDRRFLHRGIAARAFQRQFQLADYVQVSGASLENGLLAIDLRREVPDSVKPRKIEIGGGDKAEQQHLDPPETSEAA
jgi:molecular chaperone IbpA